LGVKVGRAVSVAAEIPPSMSNQWRVESVSDEGVVELVFPDEERRTVTVPRELVPKFQRIVEMDREQDRDRREQATRNGRAM
jgi:hypothetical protein